MGYGNDSTEIFLVFTRLVVMVTFKAMLPFALQAFIPLKHPIPRSLCRRVETKNKTPVFLNENKSPVFLNENRIARTKLLSMPVINILHVP